MCYEPTAKPFEETTKLTATRVTEKEQIIDYVINHFYPLLVVVEVLFSYVLVSHAGW